MGGKPLRFAHSAAYASSAVADCGRNFINLAATVAEQLQEDFQTVIDPKI